MKKVLAFVILLFVFTSSKGQKSEIELLNTFFELYRTNPEDALEYIYQTNKWISNNGDSVKQLKSQMIPGCFIPSNSMIALMTIWKKS